MDAGAPPLHPLAPSEGSRPVAVDRLQVKSPFTLVLRVQATARFPGEYDGFRVELPFYHASRACSSPQMADPEAPGYTQVLAGPAGTRLRCRDSRLGALVTSKAPAYFTVRLERPLAPGERLQVAYGQGPRGLALAQELATEPGVPGYKPFECRLQSRGIVSDEVLATASPAFVAQPASCLRVVAPATARLGQELTLRLAALDPFGNLDRAFDGSVSLRPEPLQAALTPVSTPVKGGLALLDCPGLAPAGVRRLEAVAVSADGTRRIRGRSNPVLVRTTGPAIFYGDLHVHCGEVSEDAYGSLEDVYAYARDVAALDFVAKTDHDNGLTVAQWLRTRDLVRRYDAPGRFVALLGYEWTALECQGHRTVLFPSDRGPLAQSDHPGSLTPEGLWRFVADEGGLTYVHNPTAEVVESHCLDWARGSPVEPLVEVFSQWTPLRRAREAQDPETCAAGVQKALTVGHRLGLVGGSDNHVAMAGRTGGFTAVLTPDLSRAGLFEALRARRTFATSGNRAILEFNVDGAGQGETSTQSMGPVSLSIDAHGDGPLARVELVRGWPGAQVPLEPCRSWDLSGAEDAHLEWTDPAPLLEAFYYARLRQRNGGEAWSSPVWVCRAGAPLAPATSGRALSWKRSARLGPWEMGRLFDAAPASVLTSSPDGGFVYSIGKHRRGKYGRILKGLAQYVRSAALELVPGRRYRLSFNAAAADEVEMRCLTLDDEAGNPGVFASLALRRGGEKRLVERQFTAGAASGAVRLYFFFRPKPNLYRLDGVRLEEAADSAEAGK